MTFLDLQSVIDAIANDRPLSLLKLCHGTWEWYYRFSQYIDIHSKSEADWKSVLDRYKLDWPPKLFIELNERLRSYYTEQDIHVGISMFAYKDSDKIAGTPFISEGLVRKIASYTLGGSPLDLLSDGLIWKNSLYDGEFEKFISLIRSRPIVVVGPRDIRLFGKFAGFHECYFVEVSRTKAAWDRNNILLELGVMLERLGSGSGALCLLAAGELLSCWLCYQLQSKHPSVSFLVLGQAMNISNIGVLEKANWFVAKKKAVCRTIEKINPDWNIVRDDFLESSIYSGLSGSVRWPIFASGLYPCKKSFNRAKTSQSIKVDWLAKLNWLLSELLGGQGCRKKVLILSASIEDMPGILKSLGMILGRKTLFVDNPLGLVKKTNTIPKEFGLVSVGPKLNFDYFPHSENSDDVIEWLCLNNMLPWGSGELAALLVSRSIYSSVFQALSDTPYFIVEESSCKYVYESLGSYPAWGQLNSLQQRRLQKIIGADCFSKYHITVLKMNSINSKRGLVGYLFVIINDEKKNKYVLDDVKLNHCFIVGSDFNILRYGKRFVEEAVIVALSCDRALGEKTNMAIKRELLSLFDNILKSIVD